jgi:hypothetical protein
VIARSRAASQPGSAASGTRQAFRNVANVSGDGADVPLQMSLTVLRGRATARGIDLDISSARRCTPCSDRPATVRSSASAAASPARVSTVVGSTATLSPSHLSGRAAPDTADSVQNVARLAATAQLPALAGPARFRALPRPVPDPGTAC